MFLDYLKNCQRVSFLALAAKVIQSDGKTLPEELELFEALRKELELKTTVHKSKDEKIELDIFDTYEVKRVVLIELLAIGYVDGKFSIEERVVINEVATAFSVPPEELKQLERWVLKQNKLYEEALKLIEK